MAPISEQQKTNRWTNTEKLLQLIKDHPDLPVVPMVDCEVVGYDTYPYWLGHWEWVEVTEYYCGREKVHFKGYDDEEDVLMDMKGCKYCRDPQIFMICRMMSGISYMSLFPGLSVLRSILRHE